jgi:S-(hydroxymethyl)glutathione dehydrogenase / alcohol dehydrogenase
MNLMARGFPPAPSRCFLATAPLPYQIDFVAGAGQGIRRVPSNLSLARFGKVPLSAARGRTDGPRIVDWYLQGKIEIDPMIIPTLPLDCINRGLDVMRSGNSIRSVVTF